MNKREKRMMFLLALLGGVVGGSATSLLVTSEAFAQRRPPPPPVMLNAEEYHLIDRQNREHAVLATPDGKATLVLKDGSGAARVVLDASGALQLFSAAGKPALTLGARGGAGEVIAYDAAGKQNVLSDLKAPKAEAPKN